VIRKRQVNSDDPLITRAQSVFKRAVSVFAFGVAERREGGSGRPTTKTCRGAGRIQWRTMKRAAAAVWPSFLRGRKA